MCPCTGSRLSILWTRGQVFGSMYLRPLLLIQPILLLCLMATFGPVRADPLVPEIGDGGSAYQEAVRRSGVRSEILYLSPDDPRPELTRQMRPERTARSDRDGGTLRASPTVFRVGVIVLFVGLLGFLWWATRGEFVRFGRLPTSDRTGEGPDSGAPAPRPPPLPIDRIVSEPDRKAAVIALLYLVLDRASVATGLRFHPSWTARDILYRLPQSWPFRPAVEALVRTAEQAHFGDYPVSREQLDRHLRETHPIIAGRAA
jgi:hypothetical protein